MLCFVIAILMFLFAAEMSIHHLLFHNVANLQWSIFGLVCLGSISFQLSSFCAALMMKACTGVVRFSVSHEGRALCLRSWVEDVV